MDACTFSLGAWGRREERRLRIFFCRLNEEAHLRIYTKSDRLAQLELLKSSFQCQIHQIEMGSPWDDKFFMARIVELNTYIPRFSSEQNRFGMFGTPATAANSRSKRHLLLAIELNLQNTWKIIGHLVKTLFFNSGNCPLKVFNPMILNTLEKLCPDKSLSPEWENFTNKFPNKTSKLNVEN